MTTLEHASDILAKLIAFPTVSSDSNLELIAYAADLLGSAGASLQITPDATGTKANLFATLGPSGDGGIVLSGHTDVVPVDGQDWSSDPFQLVERDGRLYGRGTCDMKGFVACCLAMAPSFADSPLKRPLHFAFTYDEEIGCFGARALVDDLGKAGVRPAAAIIGEPTGMKIVEGHKGCFEYTVEFRGLEGHGSRPERGVNAVEYAARYVTRLLDLAEELKARAPAESRFTPPWTTLQIGRINGGVAHNVIASQCAVDWEMRPVQQADAVFVKERIQSFIDRDLLPAMHKVWAEADIVTNVIGEVDGLRVDTQSEACTMVRELTGLDKGDVVAFGTEAGLFQNAGISAIVCGPGSIAQAHRADEFVALEQLQSCLQMLDKLRSRMAA